MILKLIDNLKIKMMVKRKNELILKLPMKNNTL